MAFGINLNNILDYIAPAPAYTGKLQEAGLITAQDLENARNQSMVQGLLNTGLTYLAQPKNQNLGLGVILGRSGLAGLEAMQQPMQKLGETAIMNQKFKDIATAQENKKLIQSSIDNFITSNPSFEGIRNLPTENQAAIMQDFYKDINKTEKTDYNAKLLDLTKKQANGTITDPEKVELATLNKLLLPQPNVQNINVDTKKDISNFTNIATEKVTTGESIQTAQKAKKELNNLSNLYQLNQSGKILTGGPFRDQRDWLMRNASFFGVGGKDSDEKAAATQQALQKWAQAQLDAGAQLKGPPSDKEQDLLKNGAYGDITKMNPTQLSAMIRAGQKIQIQTIQEHNDRVNNLITLNKKRLDRNPTDTNVQEIIMVLENSLVKMPVQIGEATISKG